MAQPRAPRPAATQEAHGDDYLGALEGGRKVFVEVSRGEIRSEEFDLNGLWAPWYTLHKLFAGLRDAYRLTGNRAALDLEVRFAEWAEGVLSPLDEAQVQQMLGTEFGGMNEVLVQLYADTSDPRWLALSHRFEHDAVVGPLQRHQDVLPESTATRRSPSSSALSSGSPGPATPATASPSTSTVKQRPICRCRRATSS